MHLKLYAALEKLWSWHLKKTDFYLESDFENSFSKVVGGFISQN